MHQLLHRRRAIAAEGASARPRWVALAALLSSGAFALGAQTTEPLSVRITSPLGRTGTPGAVRVVARIQVPERDVLKPVRFFVDGTLIHTDEDGPPYAAEWMDDSPFERRAIVVEAEDSAGRTGRDEIVLQPYEVTDKTQVFSVLLEATVRDKTGRFVIGLGPANFAVEEDGHRETADLVRQEAVPATFALLVDSSQSMSRRFDFVRDAANRLVSYLRPLDRVLVAPFTKELAAVTGPTNDRDTVIDAIGAIRSGGGTAIFDGLKGIADRISLVEGRRSIILITDGYDENSQTTFADAVQSVKRSESTVYVIAIGGVAGISLRGERQMKQLAAETGGRAFFPPRLQDLPTVYDQLARDAQNRYILSFTPTNQKQDGGWRRVSLHTGSPEDVVLTREGYYAPMAPPIRPTIEFTVTNADEQYIEITRDELIVKEDGVEQQVDTFQEAVDPVQIVLTLDESGSMRRAAEAVKAAAADFVRALKPTDPLALITFADKPKFAHDLSTTREWSLDAIDQYVAKGGTALYDAMYNSLMRLKSVRGRRAVVLLSDGRDENDPGTAPGSIHTFDEVLQLARDVEAVIFPIGLGPSVDRVVLERLAEVSAGRAYFAADVAQLPEEYRNIVENLHRRYVLSYPSSNPDRNGKWRRVDIAVRGTGLLVKSRGGYFAPER